MHFKKKWFFCLIGTLSLTACGGGSNNDPDASLGTEITQVAPYDYPQYQAILLASKLQRSDPDGVDGNKSDLIEGEEFIDYFDDYFYAEEETKRLVFRMRGYSNRSELRVLENFDITEAGVQRTLQASLQPIDIEATLAQADGDEITLLQVHNKGTNSSGEGYIPHPLLRVTYESERNGLSGHYWAVIKTNALDCSSSSADANSSDCSNAYSRIDLGEADLSAFTDFKVRIAESQLMIEVNDITKVNYDISYWNHLLSYFKAGVYNQYTQADLTLSSEVQYEELTTSNTSYDASADWDINNWKITLPVSRNDWYGSGGTSAAEVLPTHCGDEDDTLSNTAILNYNYASGAINFFDVQNGRMHFRADMGYGTTTENTSYIRSELRELFDYQNSGTCSTSGNTNSWGIADSGGSTHHTLVSNVIIESIPSSSVISEPKVVVGQVHGKDIDKALVKLMWEGASKPVRVILNQHYSSGDPFSVELGTYAVGEEWQYRIEVTEEAVVLATQALDGSNAVTQTLPWGTAVKDNKGNNVTLDNSWLDPNFGFYFKAGIYPQFSSNSAYSGERFDVSFSKINISHN